MSQTTAFQNERLRELVGHAYRNVPFYRRKFDEAGLEPRHIRTVADLPLIPLTTRAELQSAPPSDVVARGTSPRRLMLHKTSGTTGEPMILRRTWLEERAMGSLRASDLAGYGISSSDRIVSLVRFAPREKNRRTRAMLAAARRRGRFASDQVSFRLPPDEILATPVELKPDVLAGYPGVLAELGDLVTGSGRRGPRPKFIITGAEVLTPGMARRIKDAFGGRMYDKYGANELGRIASQCPEGSQYHFCRTGVIAEILNDGVEAAPGEDGEIVATGLHSFSMPFIRYRLGDTVAAGTSRCDCGRHVQAIRSIRGRSHEFIELPDGRRLHFYILTAQFYDMTFRWMRCYAISQESPGSVVLRIVPKLPPTSDELSTIREGVSRFLGADVRFSIELCDALPVMAGKG